MNRFQRASTLTSFKNPLTQSSKWFSSIPRPRYTIEEALLKLRERSKYNPKMMFSVNFALNLDYRVKSNRMHGVFELPHGLGRRTKVAAFTYDDERKVQALMAGAEIAGDLDQRFRAKYDHRLDVTKFDRVVADTDVEDMITKPNKLRTNLRKLKMLPCFEQNTLVTPNDFHEAVYKHVHGIYRPYETDYHGNLTTSIGRASQDDFQLVDNINDIMNQLFEARPNCFGTGPSRKRKNIGIFVLKMHLAGALNVSLEIDQDSIPILTKLNKPEIQRDYQVVSDETLELLQRSL